MTPVRTALGCCEGDRTCGRGGPRVPGGPSHNNTTPNHIGEQISSPSSKIKKDLPQSYGHNLVFHTK